MLKKIIFATLYSFLSVQGYAQQAWRLSNEKDGIKVFTRSMNNSTIKAVKVECSLAVKPSQLVNVILDIENSFKWVYHGKGARVIKMLSPKELYYYSEVIVPWPCQNRDYVAHIMVSQDLKTNVITIDAPCVSGFVPIKENVVRITHSVGRWTINATENNETKVTYELSVDPAGSVPAWLTNLFAAQGPMETFRRLRIYLQQPEVKNIKAAYIDSKS
jgi:hypothetical protein